MKNLVIMFVKDPKLGCVKTRLAKHTSDEFALNFYQHCVQDLLHTLEPFDFVLYSYPNVNFYGEFDVYKQEGESLGDKMYHAFDEQFEKGYENIVLIGSDTPHLEAELLLESFEALQSQKMVIGPSLDGGYYLIGLTKQALKKELFENITWSTELVLEQTLQKVNNKGVYLLKSLNDIDTLEDLKSFYEGHKNETQLSCVNFIKASEYENL